MGRPWLSLPTLQNRQNHAFFHILAPNLLKTTRFSTFWLQICSKTRVFSTFWRQICSKTRVFPRFWLQNASKQRVFLRFGFQNCSKTRVFPRFWLQNGAFFHVLASELLKNACFSMFLPSKWLKATCFPKFWLQHCSKNVHYIIFLYKFLQLFFDVFGLKRFKKTHFFPCVLFQNFAMQGVFFYRQAPLHTGATRTKAFTHRRFTHISFCTPKHLNTSAFYRIQTSLHRDASEYQSISTQMLFPVACTAQGVPPMVGNVPRTKPQQEDLVKTHISPKPLNTNAVCRSL